jgi:hypothetical protein
LSSPPKFDGFINSHRSLFSVIPAKAGIQALRALVESLDPDFHRGEDFLQNLKFKFGDLFALENAVISRVCVTLCPTRF